MKPIDLNKLPTTLLDSSTTFAKPENKTHLDAAAALLAAYYETRGFKEYHELESWALSTRMGPSIGGNHPGRLRVAVDETIAEVEKVFNAEAHIKTHGKDRKALVGKVGEAGEDIIKLQATIDELQQSVADKQAEQRDAEAQLQKLDDCEQLIEDVKAEPWHGRRKMIYDKVKAGKHGYE